LAIVGNSGFGPHSQFQQSAVCGCIFTIYTAANHWACWDYGKFMLQTKVGHL